MLNPRKLRHSKWTAVSPQNRQKHFLVTAVIEPAVPGDAIEWVDLEAVHSRRVRRMQWRELTDSSVWLQGWL